MDIDGEDTALVSVGDEVDAAAAELLNRRSASEMRAFFREMQWGDSDGLDGLTLPLIEDIVAVPPPQEFVSGVADTLRRLGVDEGGVAEVLAPFGAVAVAPSAPAPANMYPVAVFYTNAADESPLSSVTTSPTSSSASSRESSPSSSSDGSVSDGDSVDAASVAPPNDSAHVLPTAAGADPGVPFYPGFTPIIPAAVPVLPQPAPLPPSHLPYLPGEYELEADDDVPLAIHAHFRRPSVQAALAGYRDANNAAEGSISDRFAYAVVDAKKILEGRGMSSVPAQWIFSVRTDFEFVFALEALASMILSRPLSPVLNHHFIRDDDLNGEIEDCRTVEGAVLRMQIDAVARGRLGLVEEQLVLRRRALQGMFDAGFYYDTNRYEVASHTIYTI
ncbi:hypothetical protein EXIGLDRAFT_784689 [Exidia glandulosa HHB12029]|uniref:Uncharacterized protein n=1 Tax=Exidia glandulosa HHB12029 TaxID=1314781 RepID=A0A166MBJ2_EXIGL|nr:hypothetical protein EXIGLDRAFT_784689 [Exidia glandulosa HHB12029]